MSFRRKLQLLFLFASAVPLTLALAAYSVSYYRDARDAVLRQLAGFAAQTARRLDDMMLSASRDFSLVASDDHLFAADANEVSFHLSRFGYNFPYFRELLFVGADGAILAASDRRLVGRRLADHHDDVNDALREVGRGAASQMRIMDLDEMVPSKRAGFEQGRLGKHDLEIHFLSRIENERGNSLGVLIGTLGAEAIADDLADLVHDMPEVQSATLLSRSGEVLASTDSHLRLLARHPFAGDAKARRVTGESGQRLLVASAAMKGFGAPRVAEWQVMLQMNERAVTSAIWRTLGLVAVAAVLLLGAAAAAAILLARTIAGRLDGLATEARAAAQGDFSSRLTIRGSDELTGIARAFNSTLDEVAAGHARILDELAERERTSAALAGTNRRLDRQNREVTLRNEMSDLLQSCIDVNEAGAVIARFIPLLFPDASGAVYLHNSGSASLAAVSRWGAPEPAEVIGLTDCWALRRGRTHLAAAAGGEAPPCPHAAPPAGGHALCVPLSAHGETLGLLHLACVSACAAGEATMEEKLRLAEALAAQIGMALANLRLREDLREQSIRDALTGLCNRRYLEESLERELARAARENRNLAVFMLDVDHFKKFNDSYGHEAGDAMLRALGRAMHGNARAGDLVCRFGGEEFTAVLPGTAREAAREWCERLQERVRGLEVKSGGETLPPITLSLGLALYPEHGSDRETLLQAADLALYDAKHAGRGRMVVSGEAA